MIRSTAPSAIMPKLFGLSALFVLAGAAGPASGADTPAATPAAAVAAGTNPAPTATEVSGLKTRSKGVAVSVKESLGLVKLGGTLTDRGDFAAAEIAFRQVLEGDASVETTKSALLGLAHMHRKQGALTKAAAIYEKFLKEYPGDDRVPDALLDLGRTLRDMGAPRLAISRFYNVINSTLKLPSGSGFEHYQLLAKTAQFEVAETHFDSGDYAEANKFFSRLRMLDLAPSDRARAHFKSAYSLQLAGDLDGSITSLRSFLDQWPDDVNAPEARYLLATTLRIVNRPQEALAATLDLLRAEHSRSLADQKRWSYWQRRTGNQLANAFYESGDILNALAIYHGLAALSDEPMWRIPVSYQIALCYERLGDTERATKTFHSLVDSAGPNPTGELGDIARMASARLTHVGWRETTDHQVATLFDSNTGQLSLSANSKPAAADDANRSAAPTPSAL